MNPPSRPIRILWKRAVLPVAVTCALTASISTTSLFAQSSIENLRKIFQSPPDSAKPMVRWWWFGTAVEKPEILRELQQMKADGIAGAELAFVYPEVLDDPAKGLKNLPFLSPGMLDAVTYAQVEARKLGLRIDVTLCSGWPYGGADTPIGEAAGTLRTLEIPLPASATSAPSQSSSTPMRSSPRSSSMARQSTGTPRPPALWSSPSLPPAHHA